MTLHQIDNPDHQTETDQSRRRFVRPIATVALFTTIAATALALSQLPSQAEAPQSQLIAQDTMSRSVSAGLGTALIGGAYTLNSSADVGIANGTAQATVKSAGSMRAVLAASSGLETRADTSFTLPTLPASGTGAYVGVTLRQQPNGNNYNAQLLVAPSGATRIGVNATVGGVQTSLGSVAVGSVNAGQQFTVESQVTGTNPVTVQARAFVVGTTPPNWQLTTTSTPATAIAAAGSVGVSAYTSSSSPTTVVDFDNVQAWVVDNNQTTGVPAGATLTQHVGDIIITTPGTVLDHMDITGFVKVRAANVTISNSIVRGSGPATSNTALIDANNAAVKNLVVSDTTLVPNTPSVWLDGIIGHDYTANRVDVYNTVDGFGVYNATGTKQYANVTIENSYIHDLSYFNSDPNHSDGTHNDGIQIQGGANITIVNNTIQAFRSLTAGTQGSTTSSSPGTGILAQGTVSPVSDLTVTGNTIDGGYYGLRIRSTVGTGTVGTVSDNHFGRNGYLWGSQGTYQLLIESQSDITFTKPLTSNMWSDTSTDLQVGKTLGIRYGNY